VVILTGFCWLVGQRGSEQLLGYNYFNWSSGDVIEEIVCPVMKNEEMDVSVLKMEEMDG